MAEFAKREGATISKTSSTSAKEVYKQNSSDIRKADKIVFNEKGVPETLEKAVENGGQYSRAEKALIESRDELYQKTIFKNE